MHIRHERLEVSGEGGELSVVGELDAYTCPVLSSALTEAGDSADVGLDLAGVTFIDSSALRVLVLEHRRLAEVGRSLRLRSPSDAVVRLLDVSGLSDHFDVTAADGS